MVFVFDGAQAGGYAGFAVGDEVAVGSAAGAFGQVLAGQLDLAKVSFAFSGISGDGVDRDVRSDGVQDESSDLAVRVAAGQDGRWLVVAQLADEVPDLVLAVEPCPGDALLTELGLEFQQFSG